MLLRGLLGPGAAAWSAISGLRGLVLLLLCLRGAVQASEITFELPDNAKQCFYEEIAQGTKCTLEFQVITRPRGSPGQRQAVLRWGIVQGTLGCPIHNPLMHSLHPESDTWLGSRPRLVLGLRHLYPHLAKLEVPPA